MISSDSCVRAISQDCGFRVIVGVTTSTCREIAAAQKVDGPLGAALAGVVTGALLVRQTMAPGLRVQILLTGSDGQLAADAFPDGSCRGLVRQASPSSGRGGTLRVMRMMSNGRVQEGIVNVSTSATVSEALMAYMQDSEQVLSVIGVFDRMEGTQVVASAGYVVQLLPEFERDALATMVTHLEKLDINDVLSPHLTASQLLDYLMGGILYEKLEESPVRFGCTCTEEKVLGGLLTLGQRELSEIVARGEALEVDCDYCRRAFVIPPLQIAQLLKSQGEA